MNEDRVSVAAVQLASGSNPEKNVEAAIALVEEAAANGAQYVQLPEYFNYLGPSSGFEAAAESIPGPTTTRLAHVARSHGIVLHIGSMLEASSSTEKFFNTSVVIDGAGEIAATYRKAHLFDIDVPGEVAHRESDSIARGDQLVVADVGGLRLGLSICFDVRFPEMYRQLALHGASVLAIPAAFNQATGRVHWDVLVRARAIENHAYVIAAAQVGTTAEGFSTYGHSMIVGPWGEVLAESLEAGEDVLAATIDLSEVARRRSQIAVLELRRPEFYDSLDDQGE
jgi:predicted amidohydrolase